MKKKKQNGQLFDWIRGGIRKVGDLVFSDGILDERSLSS